MHSFVPLFRSYRSKLKFVDFCTFFVRGKNAKTTYGAVVTEHVVGYHCLENGWVRFDAALVALGVGTSVLEAGLGSDFLNKLGPIMVLRILLRRI